VPWRPAPCLRLQRPGERSLLLNLAPQPFQHRPLRTTPFPNRPMPLSDGFGGHGEPMAPPPATGLPAGDYRAVPGGGEGISTTYGEEVEVRRRKVISATAGPGTGPPAPLAAVDTVITNALILDLVGGGQGRTSACATPHLLRSQGRAIPTSPMAFSDVIGPGTEAIAGEGHILTAGALETHIHFHLPAADRNRLGFPGFTTLAGRRPPAPGHGRQRHHLHPGAFHMACMLAGRPKVFFFFFWCC